MSHRKVLRLASGVILLALAPLPALAQEPSHQDQILAKIEARRMEIRHHTEVLESVDDPEVFQRQIQTHFLMTEELLAWIVEHQSHRLAAEAASTQGAGGGAMEMDDPAGAMPGMGKMGGMGKKGRGDGEKMGMGHMGGMGNRGAIDNSEEGEPTSNSRSGTASTVGASSAAASRIAEREAMLEKISTHTLHLESIKDSRERARENVKHQLMLERLMEKMQQ